MHEISISTFLKLRPKYVFGANVLNLTLHSIFLRPFVLLSGWNQKRCLQHIFVALHSYKKPIGFFNWIIAENNF